MAYAQLLNFAVKAGQAFTLATTVTDVTTTLMSVSQTITIEVLKGQLRSLYDKHKEEFDTMEKVGKLMDLMDGNQILWN